MGFFTKNFSNFFSKKRFDLTSAKKLIFPRSSVGLILLLFFAACSQKPARVIDNSSKSYKKNYSKPTKARVNKESSTKIVERDLESKNSAAPLQKNQVKSTQKNSQQETDLTENSSAQNSAINRSKDKKSEVVSEKIIEVEAGQTLHGVAKKYQVTISELAKANDLESPYILKKGQRLKIPQSQYHEVKAGETLYGISRTYGMKIDQIIALNDLKKPYAVKVGSFLKVKDGATTGKAKEEVALSVNNSEENNSKNQEEVADKKFVPLAKVEEKSNRFAWPHKGKIISGFGPKKGGLYNDGINISAKRGDEVKAAEDGVVAYVGNELKGYGNLIIVKHSGGWISAYAHLEKSLVKRGEKVKQGQKIAVVGASGNVKSPQLYFGLRKGRDAVNPQNHLK